MKRFSRSIFLLISICLTTFWQFQIAEAQNRPLTYVEIITALNTKVPNQTFKNKMEVIDYIIKQVNFVGVEGELTADFEKLLWQAGANEQLIRAIKVKAANSAKSAPTQTFSKIYPEMSEKEKREFIETKANEFLDKFGRTDADKIPPKAVDSIKVFVESYLRRLSVDENIIGNGEEMVSKNNCLYARGKLANVLKRGSSYSSDIIDSFVNKGVYPELGIYTAFLESEFCPCIQAPTGPLGMFQFTAIVGSLYGLNTVRGASPSNPDERCEPRKASQAAASYFKTLLEKHYGKDLNGTLFSIAAYNSGEGSLNKNIATVRQSNISKVTFWNLVENKDKLSQQFQTENAKYVPKFLAAAIIGENPKSFGFVEFEPLSNLGAKQTSMVKVSPVVNADVEFWQKQKEKALEPRNKPTGQDPAGLIIPNELRGTATKQMSVLREMKLQGFLMPMDFFDIAKRSLSKEFVELPLVTETYFLDVGGNTTEGEFTKFSFEEVTTPSTDSPEYKSLETFANSFSPKYDLNKPSDRRQIKIRLLRMLHPKAKAVLEEIAQKYKAKFARPMRVTSLIRSLEYQANLNRVDAGSFLVREDGAIPPHCSGLAFDLAFKQMTAEEQNFVLGVVAEMERNGRVDGVRESGVNAAIHVFVL